MVAGREARMAGWLARNALIAGLVLLGAASPARAQTVAPATADDPMMWINHYPGDTVLGRKGFFRIPLIRRKLAALLSAADLTRIVETYRVAIPIAEVDGYLIISGCMPHDCGAEGDTIAFNPATGDLTVGFIRTDAGASHANKEERLYSTAEFVRLPPSVFRLLFHTLPTGR
ncbi:MAG: hypothetical protein ACP5NI_09275 [Acetobacteraceae bacterium]